MEAATIGDAAQPRHGIRIAAIWAVLAVILVPIVIFLIGPHIPPFHASRQSTDQHNINVTLSALATPIVLFVWVYFGYSIAVFRQPRHGAAAAQSGEAGSRAAGQAAEAIVDGPPLEGDARLQVTWLVATSAIVLGLAVFGTVDLLGSSPAGAGGGQGPNPLAKPADVSNAIEVQVIGQQWLWTFRYPGYGGVETPDLVVPVNREIAFHVTSLDVAHSFWAYELGVKADAIPGTDNVAYATPEQVRTFQVRCAELCGLWHGHMNTTGRVMTQAGFASWIAQQQQMYAGVTKQLPPYSHVYYALPLRRAP